MIDTLLLYIFLKIILQLPLSLLLCTLLPNVTEFLMTKLIPPSPQAATHARNHTSAARPGICGTKREWGYEADLLKGIHEAMKANTDLLTQIVAKKPPSLLKESLNYVGDFLRVVPDIEFPYPMEQMSGVLYSYARSQVHRPSQSSAAPPPPTEYPQTHLVSVQASGSHVLDQQPLHLHMPIGHQQSPITMCLLFSSQPKICLDRVQLTSPWETTV